MAVVSELEPEERPKHDERLGCQCGLKKKACIDNQCSKCFKLGLPCISQCTCQNQNRCNNAFTKLAVVIGKGNTMIRANSCCMSYLKTNNAPNSNFDLIIAMLVDGLTKVNNRHEVLASNQYLRDWLRLWEEGDRDRSEMCRQLAEYGLMEHEDPNKVRKHRYSFCMREWVETKKITHCPYCVNNGCQPRGPGNPEHWHCKCKPTNIQVNPACSGSCGNLSKNEAAGGKAIATNLRHPLQPATGPAVNLTSPARNMSFRPPPQYTRSVPTTPQKGHKRPQAPSPSDPSPEHKRTKGQYPSGGIVEDQIRNQPNLAGFTHVPEDESENGSVKEEESSDEEPVIKEEDDDDDLYGASPKR